MTKETFRQFTCQNHFRIPKTERIQLDPFCFGIFGITVASELSKRLLVMNKLKILSICLVFIIRVMFPSWLRYYWTASFSSVSVRFYEFTIAINLLSILCSLFMWVCARQNRKLPPPGSLSSMTSIVNKMLCFFSHPEPESGGESSHDKHYKEEWNQAFYALHSILMFLVVFIYLIGVAVIYSWSKLGFSGYYEIKKIQGFLAFEPNLSITYGWHVAHEQKLESQFRIAG